MIISLLDIILLYANFEKLLNPLSGDYEFVHTGGEGTALMKPTEVDRNNSLFEEKVNDWWAFLNLMLSDIKDKGKTPVIIAISRKMPRFIEWFKNNRASQEDLEILNDIEITSEIALPFIFTYDDIENKRFILVDDVMIHGTSVIQTAAELSVLLHGTNSPKNKNLGFELSWIASHKDADFQHSMINPSNQEEIDAIVDEISDVVSQDLPIDFEFPIFVSNKSINSTDTKDWIESIFNTPEDSNKPKPAPNSVKLLNPSKGLVCFREDILRDMAEVDFFKCRFFDKGNVLAFEVFSPAVLCSMDLTDRPQLFTNKLYQDLWERTTKKITNQINNIDNPEDLMKMLVLQKDYERSLCVWANYLLAISAYNKVIAEKINKDSDYDFSLSKKELTWILGQRLTDIIWDSLEEIIYKGEASAINQTDADGVPYEYGPEQFKLMIASNKGRLMIESRDPIVMLKGVFEKQHYTNPVFKKDKFKRYNFGETYKSLMNMILPFAKDSEIVIHNWIDNKIDTGGIVPRYVRQKGSNGLSYWRRFFHAGIFNKNNF